MFFRRKKISTPTIIQMEAAECGAASLAIVLGYFGKFPTLEELRIECGVSRDGSNAYNLVQAAKKYGLSVSALRVEPGALETIEPPSILFWEMNHFLVFEGFDKRKVYLNDPATGPRFVSREEFLTSFSGIVLSFKKATSFQKSGSPFSFYRSVKKFLSGIHQPMAFLSATSLLLLLPGFALPLFLMLFLQTFFNHAIVPWEREFLLSFLAVALFHLGLAWMQKTFLNRLSQKLSISLSSRFFLHLLSLPLQFYSQRYAGEIASRQRLNESVAHALTGPLLSSLVNVLLALFYGAAMLFYDVPIALVGIGGALAQLTVMYFVFDSRKVAYACLQKSLGKSSGEALGGLVNIETIKASGLETQFFQRWAGFYTQTINARQRAQKKDLLVTAGPLFFQMASLAFLLWFGSLRIMSNSLSVSTLVGLQLLLLHFLRPIQTLMDHSTLLQNTKVNMERLDDVMKNQRDPLSTARQKSLAKNIGEKTFGTLVFENVSFRYAPLAPFVVENLSFELSPGKKVAIVGFTGCGKSTVAKLAAGLYLPTEGKILYDGHPLEEISSEMFRNSVAYVAQEIVLFSATIRENLTLWSRHVPEEQLVKAAQDACIHEEIAKRAQGYDTPLEEGGTNLSGGQRQRLEIARALVYNPSLLILDEATSNLDSVNEQKILEHLAQRRLGVLMIAHRLSTIRDADEILVLQEGKVVERGKHEELKEQGGLYERLLQVEFL